MADLSTTLRGHHTADRARARSAAGCRPGHRAGAAAASLSRAAAASHSRAAATSLSRAAAASHSRAAAASHSRAAAASLSRAAATSLSRAAPTACGATLAPPGWGARSRPRLARTPAAEARPRLAPDATRRREAAKPPEISPDGAAEAAPRLARTPLEDAGGRQVAPHQPRLGRRPRTCRQRSHPSFRGATKATPEYLWVTGKERPVSARRPNDPALAHHVRLTVADRDPVRLCLGTLAIR